MIKVVSQSNVGKFTVLFLSDSLPLKKFYKIEINGKEYQPEIVYDMPKALAVNEKENFVGKTINFI